MASLEHLDLLLGEALECILGASGEVREINMLDQQQTLMRLGHAVSELWGVRENIYHLKPDLKRDFVREYEQDEERFEKLNDIQKRAHEAEKNGAVGNAMSLYQELLVTSRFGYFRLLAEAGLYRLSKCIGPGSDHQT